MTPIASIIIPAHNEASVIGRCLRRLTESAAAGELDIVVVCNACTDATAEIAARFGARVLITPEGSKTNAINLGNAASRSYPRIVVDADVEITTAAVRRLVAEIARTNAEVASPQIEVNLAHSSWAVRAYYRVWLTLPYFHSAIGGGVYALSEAGAARVGRFPRITADDAYVRLHFPRTARLVSKDSTFSITAPANLASLIKIKTRSRRGNLELKARNPNLSREDASDNTRHLLKQTLRPRLWSGLVVYFGVVLATCWLAYWRHLRGAHHLWERDDSSRRTEVAQ